MSLSTAQIKYIDNYLKFLTVEFIDVRVELVDHLASEFEHSGENVRLDDFLRTKKNFVKSFEKKTHKKKHWQYQKSLFKAISRYFISPKHLFFSVWIFLTIYTLIFNLPNNIVVWVFFATLFIPQLLHLFIYKKPKDMHRNIQSARYITSIMAFPSLFFYAAIINADAITQNLNFFMGFLVFCNYQ